MYSKRVYKQIVLGHILQQNKRDTLNDVSLDILMIMFFIFFAATVSFTAASTFCIRV